MSEKVAEAVEAMAFVSARFPSMGVLKLHNCTRWRLRYWRSAMDRMAYFVEAGDVGEYTWGTTYILNAERDDGGTICQGSRKVENRSGEFYAYYMDGKIEIYDNLQFRSCMPNDDNPYVSIWDEQGHHIGAVGGLGKEGTLPNQHVELGLQVDRGYWLPRCHLLPYEGTRTSGMNVDTWVGASAMHCETTG